MKRDVVPYPKAPASKKKRRGRARPEDPMRWRCEFDGCTNPATERHHIKRRAQGGGDEESNTKDICGQHHSYVHANPEWSYTNGYLERFSA